MMHNHNFAAAGAEDVPTIEKLWEEAKAARRALHALLLETSDEVCQPYHDRCSRVEELIGNLAPTKPAEIAIHLRIYLGRNEQTAAGEALAFGLVPFDDAATIGAMSPEWVPVWRFICELEGRTPPE